MYTFIIKKKKKTRPLQKKTSVKKNCLETKKTNFHEQRGETRDINSTEHENVHPPEKKNTLQFYWKRCWNATRHQKLKQYVLQPNAKHKKLFNQRSFLERDIAWDAAKLQLMTGCQPCTPVPVFQILTLPSNDVSPLTCGVTANSALRAKSQQHLWEEAPWSTCDAPEKKHEPVHRISTNREHRWTEKKRTSPEETHKPPQKEKKRTSTRKFPIKIQQRTWTERDKKNFSLLEKKMSTGGKRNDHQKRKHRNEKMSYSEEWKILPSSDNKRLPPSKKPPSVKKAMENNLPSEKINAKRTTNDGYLRLHWRRTC